MTFSFSLSNLVHPQLRLIVAQMTLFDTILFCIIHLVDKMGKWHRLPVFLVLAYLGIRRHLHQRYNLLHVGGKDGDGRDYDPEKFWYRTADGRCNHPQDDLIGSQGTFFGRNMPPTCSDYELFDPHPSVVATKLLARKKFIEGGKQFNLMASSWLQFMIHDWVDHLEDTQQVEIKSPDGIADGCPLKSFKFLKSKEVLTTSSQVKTGFLNTRTPWWDGSVLYGNNNEGMIRVRSFKDGKLKISEDGLLQHDNKGIPISGDVRNCWAGFSLLQALFIKEHNSVCDMLKKHYPDFDDEKLYRHARLVTSAVIAKIHTIDWTIELLKTDILIAGMRINWVPMREMAGLEGERSLSNIRMEQMMVSMGYQASGAITLWNYPSWMRNLVTHDINGEDRPDPVDMAALEIYRDRERRVARYNEFRRNLLMIPISKWEDLTNDEEVVETLHEVYGNDVEKLDLLVGLHAEEKIKGFAISETAFFIFLLIASRRLEADRFFTTNFNARTYTEKGLEWVNKSESMKDVINHHYPHITSKWIKSSSAFSVWNSMPDPESKIPLYLRPAP
ncbi:alpha dioxygenase isoform X3 [Tasmannia lanceolata]|uniref:alpha dioxygenase isoform X3 n=1 Tax=Tasmannia lanceolata TaxID=3420 RepID=UPI004062E47D